jgi:hypothetical protein
MKKNIIKLVSGTVGIVLLSMLAFRTEAQHVEFGLRAMPAFSKFEIFTPGSGRVLGDVTLGYGFGGLLGFHFTDHVGIQGEVIYSSFAQKYKENNLDRKVKLRYINIPLLLSLNTDKSKAVNFGIVAGPQIGINVGSSLLTSGTNGGDTDGPILSVKKSDLGFAYGAGLDFGINPARTFRLGLGFRGVYGLVDISDDSGTVVGDSYYVLDRTRIKVYSGYIGLSFLF